LLKYSALLHDVGMFLSFSNHHAHTYYIIKNAELLGFNNSEIALMASTAFYHSKKYPKKKHPEFSSLDSDSQKAVRILSMFLSIAESLDRTHHQLVKGAYFIMEEGKPLLVIKAVKGSEIELWALESHQEYFRKVFGKTFTTRVEFVSEQKNLDLEAG
ncbi:MAG TPA: HD domain-containing protein, partial [Synergistales bacterium]|nr:HD domain-containing protein [Synergistales bacterium]